MIDKIYIKLIQQYVDGWKQNNIELIKNSLDSDCIIIESHGPTYHGISEVEKWFELWRQADGQVVKWDITSFYCCENKTTAFFQWDFACVAKQVKYELLGMSLVVVTNNKISRIHEYCMTHQPYHWNGKMLVSE